MRAPTNRSNAASEIERARKRHCQIEGDKKEIDRNERIDREEKIDFAIEWLRY